MNKSHKSTSARPPRWAGWLLEQFCAPHLLEEMKGDLEELYQERVTTLGVKQANIRYVRDVFSLMRPFIIKRHHHSDLHPSASMSTNSFKAAYRYVLHHKQYACLNTLGLTLGLAACLVIFLLVRNQFTIDTFHHKGDNIYRLGLAAKQADGSEAGRNANVSM